MTATTERTVRSGLPLQLRRPRVDDAAAVLDLVERSGRLDVNSRYAYLIWCRDFAGTSVVAEQGGRIVGFVTGYVRPAAPDTYFAWQSAVDAEVVVPGLAMAMMDHLAKELAGRGIRWFETTVNPDNRAVIMLIRKLARRHGGELGTETLFDTAVLGGGHDPEVLYRFRLDGAHDDQEAGTA